MVSRGENRIVRDLAKSFGEQRAPGVVLGIGDDAAVLAPLRHNGVWTVDSSIEGVHFDRRWLSLPDVGWRSLNAAVSDIAAMAAEPIAALSSLIVPSPCASRVIRAVALGQREAARALRCPIIGGNIASGGELSITTTVLGRAAEPVLRSGAEAGDELWLLGDVGLAAAGLRWLQSGRTSRSRAIRACVTAWKRPLARLADGLSLRGRAHAAMDLSDGLAADAGRLAEASGVRLCVEEWRLEAALCRELAPAAAELGTTPLALAVIGGEDYALLAAGPARRRPKSAKVIGRIERGSGAVIETASGKWRQLRGGFDHLA